MGLSMALRSTFFRYGIPVGWIWIGDEWGYSLEDLIWPRNHRAGTLSKNSSWHLVGSRPGRRHLRHPGFGVWEGSYMGRPSPRILVQAGLIGVFFAARILRGEIPRYRLPLPEFAANFYTRSCLLMQQTRCRGGLKSFWIYTTFFFCF